MKLSLKEARDRLRRATFKIQVRRNENNEQIWGTGFFISKDGYALTAYHNLPESVTRAGKGEIKIYYKNRWLTVECDMDHSNPESDIAVLKLIDAKDAPIEAVQVGYFDSNAAGNDRHAFWAGRPVCAFGYPTNDVGLEERFVDGNIDASQPFVSSSGLPEDEIKSGILEETERLRFCSLRAYEMQGYSGSPVLDRESGYVVAVQGSFKEEWNVVYASEMRTLLDTWPGLADVAKPLYLNGQANKHWKGFSRKIKRSYHWVTGHLPRIIMAAFAAGSVFYFVWRIYPVLGRPDTYVVYQKDIDRSWTVYVIGNQQIVQWNSGFDGPSGLKGLMIFFQASVAASELILMSDASEPGGINVADRLKLRGEGARIHVSLRNIGPEADLIMRSGGGNNDSIQFAVSKDISLTRNDKLTVILPDPANDPFSADDLKSVAVATGIRRHASTNLRETRILVEEIRFERVGNFLLTALGIWVLGLLAVVIYHIWWRRRQHIKITI